MVHCTVTRPLSICHLEEHQIHWAIALVVVIVVVVAGKWLCW